MCFHTQQTKSAKEIERRFNASFKDVQRYQPSNYINGFDFPNQAVITAHEPADIQLFRWGLVPHWSATMNTTFNTLNAMSETVAEKPSFKHITHQRCLIPADGFYEWQWLDAKGKQKRKHLLTLPAHELFAFAGLWDEWIDKQTGFVVYSYTILTTKANELMSQIHNSKKRMPMILAPDAEQDWLKGKDIVLQNDDLIATPIDASSQAPLF